MLDLIYVMAVTMENAVFWHVAWCESVLTRTTQCYNQEDGILHK
jgi:hypothetical protein